MLTCPDWEESAEKRITTNIRMLMLQISENTEIHKIKSSAAPRPSRDHFPHTRERKTVRKLWPNKEHTHTVWGGAAAAAAGLFDKKKVFRETWRKNRDQPHRLQSTSPNSTKYIDCSTSKVEAFLQTLSFPLFSFPCSVLFWSMNI